ncbi:hypothetical protein L6164_026056 [Bauhinia variegata]|uniref:Uncharacterized protein n=1 Tax=Bauhinia variegata TaxID=167791 RepID=A0ACB9M2G6_BAUVA|nr:hypothetical protein L6164_026056 [Bauhinia variegata]
MSFGRESLSAITFIFLLLGTTCQAQLSSTFYDNTCPNALTTIRTVIRREVSKERRMAASLIRLHFHDCFVQGCNASILLDDDATIESEKTALPNLNSGVLKSLSKAKIQVEKIFPGIVSCADILAVAAGDASFAMLDLLTLANLVVHPRIALDNNKKLAALDSVTPNSFDNNYYRNLIQMKGLLASDQVLYNGGSTGSTVPEYSKNPTTFNLTLLLR